MSFLAAGTQEARSMKQCQEFKGHSGWVSGIIYLPGGRRMMTCSDDVSLRVWNLRTGKQIAKWRNGKSGVDAIALSLDGKKVVSGSEDGALRLWNIGRGKVIAKWTGHKTSVQSVCWNQGAGRVLSGCFDGTARVWDVESGETVLEIKTGLSEVYAAIYSPDTSMIATGGYSEENEFIKIWDANTGKLATKLKGHTGNVKCLAWTADGKTLISGSYDYSIRTWNTATWRQIAVLTGHTTSILDIAISPDGRIIASASWDSTARLWNLENGQQIGLLRHPANFVNCVSFSTDGKLLATGSWKNAYSWDISIIVREAGLHDDGDKSSLDADAQRDAKNAQNANDASTSNITDQSYDADAIDPFSQPAVNDITHDGPYNNFFASSQSSLPPYRRRLWHHFPFPSLHRPPGNGSMRLQERLKRHFFAHRADSTSPLHTPANSEQTKPTPGGKAAAGSEGCGNGVDLPECSADITRGIAEPYNDKGKQREEPISHTQTPSSDDLSSPAKYDSNENRAFWKLLKRARNNDNKKVPANMTQDPFPEVAEVNAVRVPAVYVAFKRKHKSKSRTVMSSAHTTAAHASGSSQAGPSLHGNPVHTHSSSQGQAGLSLQVTGAYDTSDDSDSDSSIQGSWNKFLDKICYPCGHYYDT